MSADFYQFVTGRLAEKSLLAIVEPLAREAGFRFSIDVLPITVAALMSPSWIARKLEIHPDSTHLVLPGYCHGDLAPLQSLAGNRQILIGPRDLRQLPNFFGKSSPANDYGKYNIEIIAEINHCPRLSIDEIIAKATSLADEGADVIDVGCEPGTVWTGVRDAVAALKDEGHRVSVDSLDPKEIALAVAAGAELVLSVNRTNRDAALDWGAEVVVVPDEIKSMAGLEETIEHLAKHGVPLRIDPILEPIGFGFAESLSRYGKIRREYPDAEMMMGIGNLTELTDVDSAGVNTLLLAICEEWQIHSVLTTQVINWARSSVRECDIARRLVRHAVTNSVLPKHLDTGLLVARDARTTEPAIDELARLADEIRDNDFRIFVVDGQIHLVGKQLHLQDRDPFAVMQKLMTSGPEGGLPKNLDASHAFYLGFEMQKALTAITLDKQYEQDESLDWGFLTREEAHHRCSRARQHDKGDNSKT